MNVYLKTIGLCFKDLIIEPFMPTQGDRFILKLLFYTYLDLQLLNLTLILMGFYFHVSFLYYGSLELEYGLLIWPILVMIVMGVCGFGIYAVYSLVSSVLPLMYRTIKQNFKENYKKASDSHSST